MLDFNVESSNRRSLTKPGETARALGDRRSTAAGTPPASSMGPKRRRYDGLNTGKHAPLER